MNYYLGFNLIKISYFFELWLICFCSNRSLVIVFLIKISYFFELWLILLFYLVNYIMMHAFINIDCSDCVSCIVYRYDN